MARWFPGGLLGETQYEMERTGQQNRMRYSLCIKKKRKKIYVIAYLAEDLINSDIFQNTEKSSGGMVNSD